MKTIVLASLLVAGTVVAVGAEDRERITLKVGQILEREVGWAMGSVCDDPRLVRAEMRNKDPETNVFVVTGLAAGTTVCRAGTYNVEDRPSYLYEITVVAAPARR